MSAASTTTLRVDFVSESAGYENTFGWYNKVTGMGGILFADVEQEGRNAPLVAGQSSATFTVNTSDVVNIEFFLIPNGHEINKHDADDLSGPIKVIQLGDGAWAVADVDSYGNVNTEHGKLDLLKGAGANALFTETSKNAGGVDYASSVVGTNQTAATLAGDTADGATGLIAWEDLAATKNKNGAYSKPGDADYNDAVFRVSVVNPTGTPAVIGNPTVADVSEDANPTTLTAAGTISITDPDAGQASLQTAVGSAAGNLGNLVLAANGSYTYSVANSAVQYLGASDTKVDSFTVTSADGTTKVVSFTIHGTNDAAVIGAPTVTDVTEDVAVDGGSNLTASGSISIADADQNQSSLNTTVAAAAGTLGSLSLAADGSYTYGVGNSAVQYLGANDIKVESFTVTSADGTTKVVTFTIHGTNDAAVIGAPTVTDVTEDAAVNDGGNLTAAGSISIADADQNQSSFNTTVAAAAGTLGSLSLAADGSYTYSVGNGAVQYLGANDTKIESFTVTSLDGTTQNVSFTIHGANDVAVIGAPTVTDVTEDVVVDGAGNLTAAGGISIADADQNQSSLNTTVAAASGTLGSLSLAADGSYTYSVANGAVQFLGATDTKTDTFTVTALDGTSRDVSFTIHGANDAAVIGDPTVYDVTEDLNVQSGNLIASGTLSISDADQGQAAFQTAVTSAAGNLGSLTLAADGSYTYGVANNSVQFLGATDTKTDTFTVTALDGTSKDVSFTIHGTNDAPTVTGTTTGSVTEDQPSALQTRANLFSSDPDGGVANWSVVGGSTTSQTQDFRFQLDNLKVVKNGFTFFEDTFNDGAPPPSGPNFSPATGLNASAYAAQGPFTEAAGRAIFDGSNAVAFGSTNYGERALLRSDISPLSDPVNGVKGLKSNSDFAAEARFDLITPEDGGDAYGIRLTDQNSAANDSTADLVVLRDATGVHVALRQINIGGGTNVTLQSINLTPTPLTQIVLRLSYDHTSYVDPTAGGSVTASFDILSAGVVISTTSFTNHATIFQGEDFTQVQVLGQSNQSESGVYKLAGTYGTLTVAQDGQWHYFLADQQANVQALSQGQQVFDNFTIRVNDGHGGITDKPVSITVNGVNDAAIIGNPTVADVTEDTNVNGAGNLTASGTIAINDVDTGQSAFQTTVTPGVGTLGTLTLATNGSYTYGVANSAVQFLGENQIKTDSFTINAVDGTAKVLNFLIHGVNDAPVAQPDSGNVVEAGTLPNSDQITVGNSAAGGNVLLNDTDPDNDFVQVSGLAAGMTNAALVGNLNVAVAGTYGALTIFSNGTWGYQLDNSNPLANKLAQDQHVTDVFTYTMTDGHGGTSNQTITVDVAGTNDAPTVSSPLKLEVLVGSDNHQLDLLANAGDPEGNSFQVANVHWLEVPSSLPPGITVNADGHTISINANDAAFTGLPAGATFDVNVSYDLVDSLGAVSHQVATVRPVGTDVVGTDEFRVNSYTDGGQVQPSVTALTDGGFVVTWTSGGEDGSGDGIYGQRYDAAGAAIGSEFRVNSVTDSNQAEASTVALADGGFVVAWWSQNQDGGGAIEGSDRGVYGQRYDAHGAPAGGEFQINTFITGPQELPAIAALNDGGFMVAWSSYQEDGSGWGVYGQRYDADGNAVGGEFRANTYTPDQQSLTSAAGLADGGFVVTWASFAFTSESNGQDGSGSGIYGQRYDVNGVPDGGEFRVNSFTSGDQTWPTVAGLADGGFVVTWTSLGQDGGAGVFAQRYDSAGAALGGELHVNTFTSGDQQSQSVTALADGGFAVTWSSLNEDGDGWGVYGRLYDSSGSAVGGEFRINETTAGDQLIDGVVAKYAIDQLASGELVATWYGQPSVSGTEAYARIFNLVSNDETVTIQNGFTFDLNVPHKGAVQFEGPTGTLKFENTNFSGTVIGFMTNDNKFDFSAITHGNAAVVGPISGPTLDAHSIAWVTNGTGTDVFVNASDHAETTTPGQIYSADMTVHLQDVTQLHHNDFIV